jgi:hypothetical protein
LAYRQSCPGREIRIIDYYEASGVDLGHYVRELAARPYLYAGHIVPHDAQAKELGTGKSRLEVLESLGLKNLQLAPLHRLEDGINAVRVFLPKMLVRCRKMRARHRRAQALSRCARARCTTGPRTPRIRFATSRSRSTEGDALRLLSPHRLSAARRSVIAQSGDTIVRLQDRAADRSMLLRTGPDKHALMLPARCLTLSRP